MPPPIPEVRRSAVLRYPEKGSSSPFFVGKVEKRKRGTNPFLGQGVQLLFADVGEHGV
jgi:hypothetical protein